MNEFEIIRHVDDGANFYLRFFGQATHMEYSDNGRYCVVRPKEGEQGVSFVFDVKLENLPADIQIRTIHEIKSLNLPVWWSLQLPDALYGLIHKKEKSKARYESMPGEELYMAILPGELNDFTIPDDITIKRERSAEDFAKWATAVNDIMTGGYADIHPVNHYPMCYSGAICCYSCYQKDAIVAVAAIINNNGICSLEFVATDPNQRRKGYAKAVCWTAIKDSFTQGDSIVTLRALNPGTKELYTSLGFKIYNHMLG